MSIYKTGLVKASILSLPFALAFTLSACDDSGTSSNGENGGNEGNGNGASTAGDFKIDDKVWSYSYTGKEGEKITINSEFIENKLKKTEIKDIGESCEDLVAYYEANKAEFPDVVSRVCEGNVITTISEIASEGDGTLTTEQVKKLAFEAEQKVCALEAILSNAKDSAKVNIEDVLNDNPGGTTDFQEETKKGPCDFEEGATVFVFSDNADDGALVTRRYEYVDSRTMHFYETTVFDDHDCDALGSTDTFDNDTYVDECKDYCDGKTYVAECTTTYRSDAKLEDLRNMAIDICKDFNGLQ